MITNSKARRGSFMGLIALAYLSITTASAADRELLDILLSNGAINQEQYDTLLAKDKLEVEDAEQIVTTLDSGGFNVRSSDGDFAFKIGSRLHAEVSAHRGDLPPGNEPVDGSELRRARIEAKGTFSDAWNWAAEIDFADNLTAVKDFFLGYTTAGGTQVSFGSQKQPYSLVVEMSSNDIPFIERSVDNFLLLPFADRAVGLRVQKSGEHWFAAGGVFGEAVNPNNVLSDEGWGLSGRYVFSPIIEDDRVLHLGVRAMIRAPSLATKSFRIRDETTHMSNLRIVDTGVITEVDRTDIMGIEAAYAHGPFSVVGEYSALDANRDPVEDLSFDSWSVYATWSITGESRAGIYRMSAGEFKRLKPATEFDPGNGSWGAWELALRYANIDLNDGAFIGGQEGVFTSGLNWYLNDNVRLMVEWSRIVETDGSTELREAAEGLDIFQFRTQYTF